MTDALPSSDSKRPPTVPGRVFVPLFVLALMAAVGGTLWLTLRIRPVAESARAKTFPLGATFEARCIVPGSTRPDDLHTTGRCPVGGTVTLGVREPGEAAKHFGYALVGEAAGETPIVGAFELGSEATVALGTQVAGPHTFVLFAAAKPLDLGEMKHALSLAPAGNLGETLLKLEQFRTLIQRQGNESAIQRLRFRIETP